MILDSKIPSGPLENKWDKHIMDGKLVNPANKRKYEIIVVGTGLAGASAASTLAELGYSVKAFTFHDSPRRAHSIAAQGGINAAKNYQNDGDSVYRLFYDTVKGGDFRSREANVYRLAQVSANIIDQCAALGVPFAREYGLASEPLFWRSSGFPYLLRSRGKLGNSCCLGPTRLCRQIGLGNVELFANHEMLGWLSSTGMLGIYRDVITGSIQKYSAHAVVLATGGYSNVFYLSTSAMNSNVTAAWRAHRKGAAFANPCYTQIHPTCIPVSGDYQSKLTLMSESLRNDGRIWAPKNSGDKRPADQIPEDERDYYLERKYPSFGNLAPRDISSRSAKEVCDEGRGVGETGLGVYLDFKDAIDRLGEDAIRERYGNLFDIYHEITGEAFQQLMRLSSRPLHDGWTLGGLQLDEHDSGMLRDWGSEFSDHGANRLGPRL